MSDNLEEVLKQAVKKIIAEAMVEAAAQHAVVGLPSAEPSVSAISAPELPQSFSIWREKLKFVSKSAACAAFGVLTCGIIGIMLFAPELAQAAIGGNLTGHEYYALPSAIEGAPAERTVAEVSWRDLASMDKVEQMLKKGAILHASPEDLSAIVIFFMLRKMAKGERIDIRNLQTYFHDSLPDDWQPVYNAIVEEYPQMEMPPVPHWFAPPKK